MSTFILLSVHLHLHIFFCRPQATKKRVRCCYKTRIDKPTIATRIGSFLRRGGAAFLNYGLILFVSLVFARAQTCMALRDWTREEKNNNKTEPFLCTIEQVIIEKTKAFSLSETFGFD